MSNTHYAVIAFSGDPASEHPDEELRGQAPSLNLIGAGPEQFCWDALARWVEKHPLRLWETAEVVQRHESVVRDPTPTPTHCREDRPMFEVIPEDEMPKVSEALKTGGCVACYKPRGDNGFYCTECDPPENDDETTPTERTDP